MLNDKRVIRNEQKIRAHIRNAQAFLTLQDEFGSFDAYIWRFVDGQPITNHWQNLDEIPAHTDRSKTISKDLKKRGFSFVGPTIIYALMQAAGLVNDHVAACFRHDEICQMNER